MSYGEFSASLLFMHESEPRATFWVVNESNITDSIDSIFPLALKKTNKFWLTVKETNSNLM